MFGTDVVSCIYAKLWNQNHDSGDAINAFLALERDQGLEVFAPEAEVLRSAEDIQTFLNGRLATIVFPGHRRRELFTSAQSIFGFPESTSIVALPEPDDYFIDFIPFDGNEQAAFAACRGYGDDQPLRHALETSRNNQDYVKPTQAYQCRQIRVVEALAERLGRPISVVDFGGAFGAQFTVLDKAQKHLISEWHVVETPELVAAAQDLSTQTKLSFSDSLTSVNQKPDLIIASSSLQYVPDFETHWKDIIATGAEWICVDRTPMTDSGETKTFLQRVYRSRGKWRYETSYPMFCRRREDYLAPLKKDYQIVALNELEDEAGHSRSGIDTHLFFVAVLK